MEPAYFFIETFRILFASDYDKAQLHLDSIKTAYPCHPQCPPDLTLVSTQPATDPQTFRQSFNVIRKIEHCISTSDVSNVQFIIVLLKQLSKQDLSLRCVACLLVFISLLISISFGSFAFRSLLTAGSFYDFTTD